MYLLRFGGALSEEPQRCIGPREIAVHGNPARRRKKKEGRRKKKKKKEKGGTVKIMSTV